MARPLRIEYPGAFYHVINRGNAGEVIFKSARDRVKFLEYLETASERFALRIHTYCLMTNHYHLLVDTPRANLGQAVKWVNVNYATYFNRKRRRQGHLFQGRYKALLVDADTYLKQLSRYIHLNPLRANMVKRIETYPWSSYPAIVGKAPRPDWLETEWLLSQFGIRPEHAMRNYQLFVEEVAWESLENPAKDLTGGILLGGTEFVDWVKSTFSAKAGAIDKHHSRRAGLCLQPAADEVVRAVCAAFQCEPRRVLTKGLKRNAARDAAIYLARDLTGKSNVSLGDYFGGISGAAITMRCNHVARQMSANQGFKNEIDRIKKQIVNR